MHVVFYAFGIRRHVDEFLKWLETRVVMMPFENPNLNPAGPKDQNGNLLRSGFIPINVGVRYGFFGTYEAIFPESAKDEVLTVLHANQKINSFSNQNFWYNFQANAKVAWMRKALSLKKVPEYKEKNTLFISDEVKKNVTIVVVGVRYDKEATLPNGLKHEGL